jgi:hypothetical protein
MKTSILTSLALRAVVRPTFLLGGLALFAIPTVAMLAMSPPPIAPTTSGAVALDLDAPSDPVCYYGSAFNSGTVVIERSAVEGRPLHLTQRYQWMDGCTWEVEETLVPHGSLYSYSYEEHVVSCEVGATPARACERHGVVTMRSLP